MSSTKQKLETEAAAKNRPTGDSNANPRFDFAYESALRGVFRIMYIFAGYLVVVHICGDVFRWSRLESALVQFVPYCLVLVGVAYRGRALARRDAQTLLMASCLACVFIVLSFNVTKNLKWFVGVPILGRDSRIRQDISSLAIMAGLASFPVASYLMLQDILLAKRQLAERVEKLQEALKHVQRLQGLLPICMFCHKIRTDQQSWQRIDLYISEHSEATFTHGLCPECKKKQFPKTNK
jgi:hypothetical protein